ncbi:TIR domain-containing protein [Mesorhizobium sp.]|uniref:TIR domain-containing protein n=1 Tax=Mesorhizobium sp. TaxID=1871066 RepID=UPI00257A5F83|nr:TIR domain-containing protein [Mesorhizobium sp.]
MTDDLRKVLINALTRSDPKPDNSLAGLFRDLAPRRENPFNSLLGLLAPQPPERPMGLLALGAAIPSHLLGMEAKERRVFFSFHYADIMRVNNVRKAMEFQKEVKEASCFYDRSVWEKVRLTNPESLKGMIQRGMRYSSVVCVLFGSETWARRWVRYEIARSVIERKGLMAANINSLTHHEDRITHAAGPNPLDYLAIGQIADGSYRLFELEGGRWQRYKDFSAPVSLPKYLIRPIAGHVSALSRGAFTYDFQQQNGSKNLGGWADLAAQAAGRF